MLPNLIYDSLFAPEYKVLRLPPKKYATEIGRRMVCYSNNYLNILS